MEKSNKVAFYCFAVLITAMAITAIVNELMYSARQLERQLERQEINAIWKKHVAENYIRKVQK